MEPQSPTPPEQPVAPPTMESPAPMPASQEPMTQSTMSTPAMASAPSGHNPGQGLGVAGLILAFFAPLIGLILSIIGLNKSKKAGMKNGLALAGIIISAIALVVWTVVGGILIAAAVTLVQKCEDLGPGTHYVDGVTYTCE